MNSCSKNTSVHTLRKASESKQCAKTSIDSINDIYSMIYALYKDICRYDFNNIPYDLIEELRTVERYTGLYQLFELMLVSRIGYMPDKPIVVETPFKIIEMFAAVYNIRISIFEIESSMIKLSEIYEEINDMLMIENQAPIVNEVLKLLHDMISLNLDIPIKYHVISGLEQSTDGCLNMTYNKFIEKLEKLTKTGNISEIGECTNILFPSKNIHPVLKKCKDLMTFLLESESLDNMRDAKKYEHSTYKFISITYTNYLNIYTHVINTNKLLFIGAANKNYSAYIQYISELIKLKNNTIDAANLSNYISLLYAADQRIEICDLFITYNHIILYLIRRGRMRPDIVILNIVHKILAAIIYTNRNIKFNNISKAIKYYTVDRSKLNISSAYEKIQTLLKFIADRNHFIEDLGYKITRKSKIGEPCVICLIDINADNLIMVKCNKCNRELGHVGCIAKWLATNESCPMCRSSS